NTNIKNNIDFSNCVIITSNDDKHREIAAIMPGIKRLDLDLPEIQSLHPIDIIKHKLEQAVLAHNGPAIVEDTSLTFSGRNGFPGPFIKWMLKAYTLDELAKHAITEYNNEATALVTVGYHDGQGTLLYADSS